VKYVSHIQLQPIFGSMRYHFMRRYEDNVTVVLNPLQTEINRLRSNRCRPVNTGCLCCKNQSVNVVEGNNAAYFGNHTKRTNEICGQSIEVLIVNLAVRIRVLDTRL
jgi:hypothetical protein